jgi:hypothetical protein
MSASTGKKKVRSFFLILVAIAGVLMILAIATATYFFFRYRQAVSMPVDASQSQVVISQPVNMAQFPAGTPIQVEVNASGKQPFTSTELWINGMLEGVQAAPSGGLTSFSSGFSWIPPEGGNYSLLARAINRDNKTTVSAAVFVFVNPPEYGDLPDPDEGKVSPVVLPASPAGSGSPQPPAPGDVGPAGPWQGSPVDWLTDMTASFPPAAPELTLAVDGCDVRLNIHDLSDNEEGFAIYRQMTNSPDWVRMKALASHSGQGWIETQDTGLSGGVTYYVTAFNSQGETSSNLALVNIDPQACPPPQPSRDLPVLSLKVQNLSIADGTANAYCYTSPGNNNWSRWPTLGFIKPFEPEQDTALLGKPLLLADLGDQGVNPGPQSMELKLECWGWQGGKLLPLGSLVQKIDLVNPQAIHLALTGLAFDILPDIRFGLMYETFKLDASLHPWIAAYKDPFDIENLGYVPESDQMPIVIAWQTYLTSECQSRVFEDSFKEVICYPMPGFNEGPGGINPQSYLVWSPSGSTCKGIATKECFNLAWWEGFTKKYPASYNPGVHFYVVTYAFWGDGGSGMQGTQVESWQQAWRVLPNTPNSDEYQCISGYRFFSVIMEANSSLGTFRTTSPMVTVPCPKPLDSVQIEVTFHSMDLQNIDDGTGNSDADNVYGQFTARVNGQLGPTLLAGWWGGAEPANMYMGSNGYIETLNDGWYNLANFQLCLQGPGSCNYNLEANYFYNNNKLVVTVKDGDALQLWSELYDYDETSADDPICNSNVWVGPRFLDQWATTLNEGYNLIQPEGDATCNVLVILNAIGPGQ